MRVGILGGTFNPPHLGHLVCAQEAHGQLGLDRVLLLPAGVPPHKEVVGDPGAEVRLELCRLAVAGDERLAVSDVEVKRAGPSYTVDTLRGMHQRAPEDELTFIVGGDMARSLPAWREPRTVLELARLGVAERAGAARREVEERLAALEGARARVDFFDMPRVDVSSSLVRERVAAGGSIRYLVPESVRSRIAELGLYGAGAA
jgi:nicotinate-nucleotide adenylyltransferase